MVCNYVAVKDFQTCFRFFLRYNEMLRFFPEGGLSSSEPDIGSLLRPEVGRLNSRPCNLQRGQRRSKGPQHRRLLYQVQAFLVNFYYLFYEKQKFFICIDI
jgi:hypothetical protein